ncbi:MAG: ATP-binding protein, partial [Paracoccaceae bacterium]
SPLPMGGWVAVYTDITELKAQEALLRARSDALSQELLSRAEELSTTNRQLASANAMLEETKRQLIQSESRTRLTTEMMPAHIAHVDRNGVYTYSNQRLSSVLPGRRSSIVGLHIREALGAAAFERVAPYLDKAYRGEKPVFEFTDTDSARRVRVAFTPDDQGGVYILSTDVTEETQTRVALQQTRRRTLAAQMTHGLAHDFANLLTIVLGLQGKMSRMPNLPRDAQVLIDGTLAATRRGTALLDRIGDMSATRPYRAKAIDLGSLLRDLVTLTKTTLPDGMRLSLHIDPGLGAVLIDPGMVQDALVNLILNARDASPAQATVSLNAHVVAGTWIDLCVRDEGPGFSDASLQHALDPFFTTKGRDGSGLGLPMVYDTAKLAGGSLDLRNTSGGAAVTLRLPFRPAPQLRDGLVLLVEDDPDLRRDIREMLTPLGHAVIEASSAEEAYTLLHDIPDIALVLSDLNFGQAVSGVDLARNIKDAPVILMTSLAETAPLYIEARDIAPVLRKPFSADALAQMIAPKDDL